MDTLYTPENIKNVLNHMIDTSKSTTILEHTFNDILYSIIFDDLLGSSELGQILDNYIKTMNSTETSFDNFLKIIFEDKDINPQNTNKVSINTMAVKYIIRHGIASIIHDSDKGLKDLTLPNHINTFLTNIQNPYIRDKHISVKKVTDFKDKFSDKYVKRKKQYTLQIHKKKSIKLEPGKLIGISIEGLPLRLPNYNNQHWSDVVKTPHIIKVDSETPYDVQTSGTSNIYEKMSSKFNNNDKYWYLIKINGMDITLNNMNLEFKRLSDFEGPLTLIIEEHEPQRNTERWGIYWPIINKNQETEKYNVPIFPGSRWV